MPENCPFCESNNIMNDYFEEEWVYWCATCGKEIVNYEDEEAFHEYCENQQQESVSGVEGA